MMVNEDECRATKQLRPLVSTEALLKSAPGQKFSNYFSDSIHIRTTASGIAGSGSCTYSASITECLLGAEHCSKN